jgi:hypothetical protein
MLNRDFNSIAIDDMTSERAIVMDFGSPENKREIPCDSCAMRSKCAKEVLECAAFRNWASKGDYINKDVTRLMRAA